MSYYIKMLYAIIVTVAAIFSIWFGAQLYNLHVHLRALQSPATSPPHNYGGASVDPTSGTIDVRDGIAYTFTNVAPGDVATAAAANGGKPVEIQGVLYPDRLVIFYKKNGGIVPYGTPIEWEPVQ